MSQKENLVDRTVLTTPKPTASSTIQKTRIYKNESCNLQKEQPVFDSDESLGIISIRSDDLNGILGVNESNISLHLQKQRELANSSLQRATKLSGLPSRYLRPSDISKYVTDSCLDVSGGSTISESDLFKSKSHSQGDTSTPRSSLVSNMSSAEPRYSLGKSMADLSNKIKNTDISLDNFAEEFKKVMQSVIIEESSSMFMPAEDAEAKLLADEMSWKNANGVPGQAASLCFTENSLPVKESMGEFFRLKSESISDLDILKPSPEKRPSPVPLIDTSAASSVSLETCDQDSLDSVRTCDRDSLNSNQDLRTGNQGSLNSIRSLSLSKIAKILEETEQTPKRVIHYLLNEGRKIQDDITDAVCRSSKGNSMENPSQLSSVKFSSEKLMSDNVVNSTAIYGNLQFASNFNKENINLLNIQDSANSSIVSRKSPDDQSNYANRSLTSVRSTSSLSTLINGKLPIDATRSELIWGCVKPGKSVIQEVIVRNKSQSRLRIQCSVSGPCYKILRDRPDSEFASIAKYILLPGESKSISVSFAPIKIGAATDGIIFTPADPNLQPCKNQKISLYGYGGYGNVEINNITKDITGKFWLCLGQLDNKTTISQTIIVQNNGTIPSFALVSFESKDMYSFASIEVSPSKFVLLPHDRKEITVTYTPSRQDLKFFQAATNNSVIDIGGLKFITGTEVNRGRIRRLCQKAAVKGFAISPVCQKLTETIPDETMPADLNLFKESIGTMTELLQELSTKEVVVTIEQDPDCTLVAQFPDDTLQFQTLCNDSTILVEDLYKNHFRLEPNCVILTPPTKTDDVLILTSERNEEVNFEVTAESKELIVHPKKGVLKPHDTLLINVKCMETVSVVDSYKVCVLVANIALEASVKVIRLRS